jgi:hypothetical protein
MAGPVEPVEEDQPPPEAPHALPAAPQRSRAGWGHGGPDTITAGNGAERAVLLSIEMTSKNISDDAGSVTQRRYPDTIPKRSIFVKHLILLVEIELVPVVGLEPTRLVKGPGF